MTAQFTDSLLLDSLKYILIGCNDTMPFVPEDYGIIPNTSGTACYRGYVCSYEIIGSKLYLNNLLVNSQNNYPVLNGIVHKKNKYLLEFREYEQLNLPLEFNGNILIGKDLISKRNMGFPKYFDVKTIKELEFKNGILIDNLDLTHIVDEIREEKMNQFNESKGTEDWINTCFSMKYDIWD